MGAGGLYTGPGMDGAPERQRPRRGSLDRPISTRLYRAAWLVVLIPILLLAFSVSQEPPLPESELPPSFDQDSAEALATEISQSFPDRSAGSVGSLDAGRWVFERFEAFELKTHAIPFFAEVPDLGTQRFINIAAIAPGASSRTIVVMAHRDNLGTSPGANDNASGTAALLELARNAVAPNEEQEIAQNHTIVFLSTDGGAYGSLGAAEFAQNQQAITDLIGLEASLLAIVNLDAIAGSGEPRIEFAGEVPRVPAAALVSTARARLEAESDPVAIPDPASQLIDLAFPFTLYAQGPLIATGLSAVTLTSSGVRPPSPFHDTVQTLDVERLGEIGRGAENLLLSLDQAADVARGTQSYLYVESRFINGWALQLILIAALLPFFVAVIDFAARCYRRNIPLLPAFRSLRSRLGVWLWAGGVFAFLAFMGVFPTGESRPIPPDLAAATDWPVAGLVAFAAMSAFGWLVARQRLMPTHTVDQTDELAGHLAAMTALAVSAAIVAAVNPFALIFVLPSIHIWLWIPHLELLAHRARVLAYAAGFVGPAVLVLSFAVRFDLGFDAFWYVLSLVSVGYVSLALLIAFLIWGAGASQVGAVAFHRYAPYPAPRDRRRGPVREGMRQIVLLSRRASPAQPTAERSRSTREHVESEPARERQSSVR